MVNGKYTIYRVDLNVDGHPGHFYMQVESTKKPTVTTHGGYRPSVTLTEIAIEEYRRIMAVRPLEVEDEDSEIARRVLNP